MQAKRAAGLDLRRGRRCASCSCGALATEGFQRRMRASILRLASDDRQHYESSEKAGGVEIPRALDQVPEPLIGLRNMQFPLDVKISRMGASLLRSRSPPTRVLST